MIRFILLTLFIIFLSIYTWKDWYKSLCGLIILMAFTEHPDMPKTMFGIQGLNPWNLLFLIIILAWLYNRRSEGLYWDMPRHINVLLLLYLFVIIIGFFRMLGDRGGIIRVAMGMGEDIPSTVNLWSEYFINTIKWVIPGLLLFDGCRSRSRFFWGLFSLLGIYFLLGLQVIKWMPLNAAISGEELTARSLKILVNEIGYHRVNLSMMLAGASWAILSILPLIDNRNRKFLIIAVSLSVVFAQSMTGGRMGYATWAVVGMILCFFRWRKFLLLIPVVVTVITLLMPGVVERMSQGFTPETRDVNINIDGTFSTEGDIDMYTITAGRNIVWPYVIEKIGESPIFGYGREAMQRTGTTTFMFHKFGEGEVFPHPHNAFLQWLIDNGWIGFIPVLFFYLIIIKYSISLFRDARDPIFIAIGGVTLSLVLALLVASIGSQSFYPREGSVGMWCAIGLMFRMYVERQRIMAVSSGDTSNTAYKKLWV